MDTHAQGLIHPAFGHFPGSALDLPRESAEAGEALPDEDVKWRRLGVFLCVCSGATTLLLFFTAYRVIFG